MRTTFDVDEKLLSEVISLTGEKTKGRAVSKALAAYVRHVRHRRIQELRGMLGTTDLIEDWDELRHVEPR